MSFAYMALFTGDYLRDTRHLTPQKHGVYLLLLMHCWDQKGPLPLDERECAGIANCRSDDEIESLRYVLRHFFVCKEDGYFQGRMQRELEKAEGLSKTRSKAGSKGFKARAKHLLSKSQALASIPIPIPTDTSNTKPKPSRSSGDERSATFDLFWAAYPRKKSKGDAQRAWTKLMPNEQLQGRIMRALELAKTSADWRREAGRFIPYPASWLNSEGWEDETQPLRRRGAVV